jgi:hypothetical protein
MHFIHNFFFAPYRMMDTNRQHFELARLPNKLRTARESLFGRHRSQRTYIFGIHIPAQSASICVICGSQVKRG